MSFLDKAKQLADRAQGLAVDHADSVKGGIDKAGGLADKATGGRFTDKINAAGNKAAEQVSKLEDRRGQQ